MKHRKNPFFIIAGCILVIGFALVFGYARNGLHLQAHDPVPAPQYDPGFWHTDGADIVDENGNAVQIKSMGMYGTWWYDSEDDTKTPSWDHDADSYAELRSLGFNAVRLLMGYEFFESEPYCYDSADWEWLDQNIAWAEENDMKIILNMHLTQGGMQANKKGIALWTEPENQDRLIEMWRMIAARYKDCTTIAGWGLINEPTLVLKDGKRTANEDLCKLMQAVTDAIRESDKNHMIFCESATGVYLPAVLRPLSRLVYSNQLFMIPYVSDYNLVHEYHFYYPKLFTMSELLPCRYPGLAADREKLKKQMLKIRQRFDTVYGTDRVPLFIGEFGLAFDRLGRENESAYAWISDTMDVCNELGLGYSFHIYHGTSMGLWYTPSYLKYTENGRDETLARLFAQKQTEP